MRDHISAAVTIIFACALTALAYLDSVFIVAAVGLAQLMIVLGPPATDDRGRSLKTPMALAVVAASGIAVWISLDPEILLGAGAPNLDDVGLIDTGIFSGVLIAIVVAFFIAVLAQMKRKDDRSNLTRTLAHAVFLSTLAALTVGWIGAATVPPPGGVVAMASGAMAFAVVLRHIFFGESKTSLAMVLGVGLGSLTALGFSVVFQVPISTVAALMLGGLSAYLSLIGHRVADYVSQSLRHSSPRIGFSAAVPVALVGPVAFVASALPGI